MVDGPGRATGPQRNPRRQPGATPPPKDDRTEDQRARQSYEALRLRLSDQAEMIAMRLAEMRPGAHLASPPGPETMGCLGDIERRITLLRVELDQIGCAL